MAAYWTYIYPNKGRGRVHRHDCRLCNDGQGSHKTPSNSGAWHPHATYAEAIRELDALNLDDAGPCFHCLPDLD